MAGHTSWDEIRAATVGGREHEPALARERALLDLEHRLYNARRAVGKSQAEVAAELGVSQANVSRIERAKDLQLSTLEKYVHALGGRLELRVVFDDEEVVLGE